MISRKTVRGFVVVESLRYDIDPSFTRLIQESSAIGDYDDAMEKPGSGSRREGDHHGATEVTEECAA